MSQKAWNYRCGIDTIRRQISPLRFASVEMTIQIRATTMGCPYAGMTKCEIYFLETAVDCGF
jgi:hypothetical protein